MTQIRLNNMPYVTAEFYLQVEGEVTPENSATTTVSSTGPSNTQWVEYAEALKAEDCALAEMWDNDADAIYDEEKVMAQPAPKGQKPWDATPEDITAGEYIETRVAAPHRERATVLGLVTDDDGAEHWWHIHRDEKIPRHVQVKISEMWE